MLAKCPSVLLVLNHYKTILENGNSCKKHSIDGSVDVTMITFLSAFKLTLLAPLPYCSQTRVSTFFVKQGNTDWIFSKRSGPNSAWPMLRSARNHYATLLRLWIRHFIAIYLNLVASNKQQIQLNNKIHSTAKINRKTWNLKNFLCCPGWRFVFAKKSTTVAFSHDDKNASINLFYGNLFCQQLNVLSASYKFW